MKSTAIFSYIGTCRNIRLLAVFSLLLLVNACDKTVENPSLEAYAPASLDENGGNWKKFVLADSVVLNVLAPAAVNTPEYQAELMELRTLQNNRTTAQEDAVRYWSAGAVLRWHEIARELAARYNLPPQANADGTYPVPDAANPFNYPKFPFANPPYAARALAYLAVAQYDALAAAWKLKYQYGRLAPSKNDATIEALAPVSDLPAYPSEHAVVAAASLEILKAMFPCEVDYLTQQEAEHVESRLIAGANVRSEIVAGEALGKQIAQLVLARSKADGMKGANNQSLVPNLIADAKTRNIDPVWISLETPARPPMLPIYGKISPWNFGAAEVIALRPPPPPALGSAEFNTALDELRDFNKNLTREQHRIAAYWSDGPGSYTPPGHWDRTACELIYKYKLNELRAARCMALTCSALMDAGICCWDVKYYFYYPRPHQMDSEIHSVVGTPNFPAYTSGHSTFSSAGATVLGYLFPTEAANMNALAKEASESRIYGCIHYRFDCEAGLLCGKNIGNYAVERGRTDGSPQ